jgi:hypothetical protein
VTLPLGYRSARLVLGALVLDLNDHDNTGLVVSDINLGTPSVKKVQTNLPGQDGMFDQTKNFGTRVLSISGYATGYGTVGSRQKVIDSLAPFCKLDPTSRPSLVFAFDTDVVERTIPLVVSQWSGPVAAGIGSAVQYQWECPDPIAKGTTTNEVDIPPFTGSSAGRVYPRSYPRVYPVGFGGSGQAFVTTAGTFNAWPLIRIFGPINNPVLTWLDPITTLPIGPQIAFTGLNILAGHYIEIDTKARTVVLDSDPNANRYSFVDFPNTIWGPLKAGSNLLKLSCAAASAPALAQVFWADAFLH